MASKPVAGGMGDPDGGGAEVSAGSVDGNQDQTLLRNIVIAVVDDDEWLREAFISLVRSLGYRAVAFQSAQEFLDSERRGEVCGLIADVLMPGMTGPELYDRLVASGTRIPTILVTAYPDEIVRARALRAGVKAYLTKPFSQDDLVAGLRAALDGQEAGETGAS